MKITALYYCTALGLVLAGGFYLGADTSREIPEIISGAGLSRLEPLHRAAIADRHAEDISAEDIAVLDTTFRAFGRPISTMVPFEDKWPYFRKGKIVFERDWSNFTDSPLGPFFSANSCAGCHVKDGRGRAPAHGEHPESMVVQLSVKGEDRTISAHPDYGSQLDYHALDEGQPGEGTFTISYQEIKGKFADGTTFTLLKPEYEFTDMAHGSFGSETRFSPRVAPAVFGLGLLEAISDQSILALADPDDRDNDGISGRANKVYDIAAGKNVIGRFGWKANQPTVAQQIARALHDDMGITSPYYPGDTSLVRYAGSARRLVEVDPGDFDKLLFYTRLLGVPKLRNLDNPEVVRGKSIFHAVGCAGCHTPQFTTGVASSFPELSNQVIRPYTDLLLHDMGEALADGRPDGLATGREWRTPPLWGIGLVPVVNKHTRFLHDGRARNLEEALLWHGGEAIGSQRMYRSLRREDRKALLAFLESL